MIANAVLATFVLTELVAYGAAAWRKRLRREGDRGTTIVVTGGLVLALVALNTAVLPNYPLPATARWAGVFLAITGLVLRGWTIAVRGDATGLLQEGPYRVIRYPGYLAVGLTWIGATVASGNLAAALTVALAIGFAGILRIPMDEALALREHGAAFAAYAQRSWRLIPFIY
jgi:protein-S-isoprenylcysteine O-methyltransferase Ste14